MRLQSRQMALSGVLSALAVVILLLGGLIPLATFCCPMLAILVLLPLREECGPRIAATAWAAVSLLTLLLVPDRELGLFYIFFGWYPLLQPYVDRLRARCLRLLCKLLFCTLSILVLYAILLFVFQLEALAAELKGTSLALTLVTLAMGNVAFLLLDELLRRFSFLWNRRLRKRFFR